MPSPDPDPVYGRGATGSRPKDPSRPCDPTLCCSYWAVQLTSVLTRVPSVLGGGLLSHLVPLLTADLESLDLQASDSLRAASEAQNPKKTREPCGRRPLGTTSAVAPHPNGVYRVLSEFLYIVIYWLF